MVEISNTQGYAYDVKGVSVFYLKLKWRDLLHHYITCEDHYGLVFLYHIHLLMVFTGHKLNLSYFLYKSLAKMENV